MGEGDTIRDAGDKVWDDMPSHSRQLNTRAGKGCPEPREGTELNRTATVGPHGRVKAAPSRKADALGAQLKCLYVNACSMENNQGELEVCVRLQGYDLIAITETWRDISHDQNVAMDGFVILVRTGQEGEVVELLFMSVSNWNLCSSA